MKAYACLMSKGKHQVEEFAAEGGGVREWWEERKLKKRERNRNV